MFKEPVKIYFDDRVVPKELEEVSQGSDFWTEKVASVKAFMKAIFESSKNWIWLNL